MQSNSLNSNESQSNENDSLMRKKSSSFSFKTRAGLGRIVKEGSFDYSTNLLPNPVNLAPQSNLKTQIQINVTCNDGENVNEASPSLPGLVSNAGALLNIGSNRSKLNYLSSSSKKLKESTNSLSIPGGGSSAPSVAYHPVRRESFLYRALDNEIDNYIKLPMRSASIASET